MGWLRRGNAARTSPGSEPAARGRWHRGGRILAVGLLPVGLALAGVQWHGHHQRVEQARLALERRQAAWRGLTGRLQREINAFPGASAVVIEDLGTGWRFEHRAEERFAAASLIKIPVMAACFRAAAGGELSLKAEMTLRGSDQVLGSGLLKAQQPGTVWTIERLVELMITKSDNTATNMLIGRLGMDALNRSFADFGLQGTSLVRNMMDFSQRHRGVENYTTAADMAHVLRRLYHGRLVGRGYSARGIALLRQQAFRDRIPARLPKGTVVAHKTGLERHVCHDVGIIYTPAGDALVCVLTRTTKGSRSAKAYIAGLSRDTYEYLAGTGTAAASTR